MSQRLSSSGGLSFFGMTLEEALAWCLVWLMAKGTPREGTEQGGGPFLT